MSPQRVAGVKRLTLTLCAIAFAGVVVVWFQQRDVDVNNAEVPFQPPGPRKAALNIEPETFVWPTYGYSRDRARNLDVNLHPPFRRLWRFNANQLLEFSPILVRGTLYTVGKNATVYALSARTGRRLWRRRVGSLNASSPTYARGRIFVATLSGKIFALDAKTGRVRWSRAVNSRTESSPLIVGNSVLFGTEAGTLFRLRQGDGAVEWTYQAGGAIKGAPAYSGGKVFVGAYGGTMHAVRSSDGHGVWRSSTRGARYGFGSGNFYATPAVAFGRVYAGNTDGSVYSFAAADGRLAWRKGTGAFVYSSAAVANVPRLGPTLFVGSHDGNFYALNARTGAVHWVRRSGGRISGAPTVIGNVVYYSDLGRTDTFGLSTRTGRVVFSLTSGAYNPAIADGKRIYLTGYESITAFVPK